MTNRTRKRTLIVAALAVAAILISHRAAKAATDPWTDAETLKPAQLAAQLQQAKDPHPLVIYVGAKALFEGAHIPSAKYFGAGSTEQGIAAIKQYAATLPKNSDVVLYCGCCPLEKCPNLRPAFSAMKEFGFSRLRVLLLPNNFNTDWVEKGYPVQRGN
jgi:hypothetical protein